MKPQHLRTLGMVTAAGAIVFAIVGADANPAIGSIGLGLAALAFLKAAEMMR